MKFSIKDLGILLITTLALATVVSLLLSQFTDLPTIKSGTSFIVILISTFLVYMFVISRSGKINKDEIFTIVGVAVLLATAGIALNKFVPEIFSIIPQPSRELFMAFG